MKDFSSGWPGMSANSTDQNANKADLLPPRAS
jgi:hypothetical protein